MKHLTLAAGLSAVLAFAAPALAEDMVRVKAAGTVAATMDALEAAVTGAGATVFARIDHAAGAQSAGMALPPTQLLVFGNPALGTPAIQAAPEAGLFLPLRVLVYENAEGVWLAYEPADEMLEGLGIPKDAEFLTKMNGALKALTAKAAGS